MFDLMIGTDAVRRRTRHSFEFESDGYSVQSRRRGQITAVRAAAAAVLRTLAERVEPVDPCRPSEPAGAYPR